MAIAAENDQYSKTPIQEKAQRGKIDNLLAESAKKKHLSGRYGPRGSYKKRKHKEMLQENEDKEEEALLNEDDHLQHNGE